MATCRKNHDGTLSPDWCTAHAKPLLGCVAEFEKRAELLKEKLERVTRIQQIDRDLAVLDFTLPAPEPEPLKCNDDKRLIQALCDRMDACFCGHQGPECERCLGIRALLKIVEMMP